LVDIRGPRAIALIDPTRSILRFLADPLAPLLSLSERFGPIAAVSDGHPELVCAFGAQLNHEVLTQPGAFEHDSALPFSAPKGSAFERFNRAMIFMNGDEHRRVRRLLAPAFQKSALDAYAASIVAVAKLELARWRTGERVDVAHALRELTLRVALRCLFGVDIGESTEQLGRLAARQLECLASPFSVLLPARIPGTPYAELIETCERLEARMRGLIDARRRSSAAPDDALSLLLTASGDDALDDDELIGQMNTLFVAGHETTATTLAWTVLLLARHPAALDAVTDEIEATLGDDDPTPDALSALGALDRVTKESLRLLPPAPVLFTRVLSREAKLGPHTLPAGAGVVLSPLVTQRDPSVFERPSAFVPERWKGAQPTTYQYIPFGAGARMCLGAAFANMALRLLLPMVLRRFSIVLDPDQAVAAHVRGITMAPKGGLFGRIERRARGERARAPVTARGPIDALIERS
jgi:cytochrome P450